MERMNDKVAALLAGFDDFFQLDRTSPAHCVSIIGILFSQDRKVDCTAIVGDVRYSGDAWIQHQSLQDQKDSPYTYLERGQLSMIFARES